MQLPLRGHIRHWGRMLAVKSYRRRERELARLRKLPRYHPTITSLPGRPLEIADAASFLDMYHEIMERKVFRFRAYGDHPHIIDGGANIGLSVMFFKETYPGSTVVAFEPDPNLCAILRRNIERNGYQKVTLIPKALWSAETDLPFQPEGGDAGRLEKGEDGPRILVPTVRLRDYLDRQIDLLKLDIEGAESEVLEDCSDRLDRVQNLVVEYHSFVGEPQALDQLIARLATAGFRLQILPGFSARQPLWERAPHLGMDMTVSIFGFREAPPSS